MKKEWENRSTASNIKLYEDSLYISFISILLYIWRRIITKWITNLLLSKSCLKFTERKKIEQKLHGSIYRFTIYLFFVIYSMFSLCNEDWLFVPFLYTLTWKDNIIPIKIKCQYLLEFSHYLTSIFFLFDEPRMSDFHQMLTHHLITLFLILLSYYYNVLRYGILIMILHDVSDPLMDSAKVFLYLKFQKCADVLFSIFAFVFILTRAIFYPFIVVLPGFYYVILYGINWILGIQVLLLFMLAILNWIWCFFISKMIISFVRFGKVKGDIRTDEVKDKKD